MSLDIHAFRTASTHGVGELKINNRNEQQELQTKGTGLGKAVEWLRSKFKAGTVSTENTQVKEAFISAVKKEYGSAAADWAKAQVGNTGGLSSRTVSNVLKGVNDNRVGFAKLHNVQQREQQINDLLQKNGGLKGVYESPKTQEMMRLTYGLDLPPFDEKAAGKFRQILMDLLPQDGKFAKYPVTLSDIQQRLGEAAVIGMWKKGTAGMGQGQIQQLLSLPPQKRTLLVENTLSQAMVAISQSPRSKPKVTEAIREFLNAAMLIEDKSAAESIVKKCMSFGLLDSKDPGVAESYVSMAWKSPKPAGTILNLCAAERCYRDGNRQQGCESTLHHISVQLEDFVRKNSEISGKDTALLHPVDVMKDRQSLAQLRLNPNATPSETSQALKEFISGMYSECLAEFGVDPKSQTFVLFGSGSRNEMFPFSDLEFAVLTDKPSHETDPKLRNALAYFEMRVISMGETPMGLGEHRPIDEGFCFDPGGNAPSSLGTPNTLLGTPQQVANQIGGNLILTEVLTSAQMLSGGEERHESYQNLISQNLSRPVEGKKTFAQEYSLRNIDDHAQKMRSEKSPYVGGDLLSLDKINAKELSRFPVFLASALCKYHGISVEVTNTKERLQALEVAKVITPQENEALSQAFDGFGDLRLLAETTNQGQTHSVYKNAQQGEPYLGDQGWADMLSLIEPLQPIYQKMMQFHQDPTSAFAK